MIGLLLIKIYEVRVAVTALPGLETWEACTASRMGGEPHSFLLQRMGPMEGALGWLDWGLRWLQ